MKNDIMKIKKYTELLNKAREKYYNDSNSDLSDYEYDRIFDELKSLEDSTGFVLANSPTQEVGYAIQKNLNKSEHKYPMLSLDKTKSTNELSAFVGNMDAIIMYKLDGLTVGITYNAEGKLEKCETRGDGKVGQDITENAKTFINLPAQIAHKGRLVVFGEAIIDYPTFYKINRNLPVTSQYENPRNLCSGSVQQLDSKICAERGVRFIAWRLVEGSDEKLFSKRLDYLSDLGFETVYYEKMPSQKQYLSEILTKMKDKAHTEGIPIDGMVVSFQDIDYAESLGATSHHIKSQLAFKFGEDREFTTLREIEWSPSRTGQLNPVAIFDTIELAGTAVSRASLHNLSIMKKLNIKIGSQIEVCKRNEIIPNIESCDGKGEDFEIPKECPICHASTKIIKDNDSEVLVCTNIDCKAKLLGRLELFASKEGMDIKGLASSQLEYFVNKGWINELSDVYQLYKHKEEIERIPGFGKKSVQNILEAIEMSRKTNLPSFIRALGIPLIGKTQSLEISKYCNGDEFEFRKNIAKKTDFSQRIQGFGEKRNQSIYDWFAKYQDIYMKLLMEVAIESKKSTHPAKTLLSDKTFAITGKLVKFANRDSLVKVITDNGGKCVGSVSSKTSYLICNTPSGSTKCKKAEALGCKVITEEDLLKMIGE